MVLCCRLWWKWVSSGQRNTCPQCVMVSMMQIMILINLNNENYVEHTSILSKIIFICKVSIRIRIKFARDVAWHVTPSLSALDLSSLEYLHLYLAVECIYIARMDPPSPLVALSNTLTLPLWKICSVDYKCDVKCKYLVVLTKVRCKMQIFSFLCCTIHFVELKKC